MLVLHLNSLKSVKFGVLGLFLLASNERNPIVVYRGLDRASAATVQGALRLSLETYLLHHCIPSASQYSVLIKEFILFRNSNSARAPTECPGKPIGENTEQEKLH